MIHRLSVNRNDTVTINNFVFVGTISRQMQGKWPEVKANCATIIGGEGEAAMDFPNLPYLIEKQADGTTLKMTQSNAILKHFARKHDLVVKGENNIARMEMLEEQVMDLK